MKVREVGTEVGIDAGQEGAPRDGEAGTVVEEVSEAAGNGVGVGVAERACTVEAGHVAESAGTQQGADEASACSAVRGRLQDGVGKAQGYVAPVAGVGGKEVREGAIVGAGRDGCYEVAVVGYRVSSNGFPVPL